ncbi:MAG: biotin--[Alphaproteobacteria bacterium]|nr:biotin--[acetyl-CoA-carboxylase] ligase [Alphaproteobacteria bacterium]
MANYKLLSFDKIPSTQDCAHDLISTGRARDGTVVLAAAQSAGRGRFRRTWVSHHGNLYTSFIFSCPQRDARLSYAVAVAVAETIASFGIHPTIKWPNDILVDGKKIAGILIEYSGRFVIVGIGINVNSNPTVERHQTTRMKDYSQTPLNELLARLMRNIDVWRRADFRSVRERWLELAACINRPVRYRGESAVLVGINENGALVLRRDTRYLLVYGDEIGV